MRKTILASILFAGLVEAEEAWIAPDEARVKGVYPLPNVLPPLDDEDDARAAYRRKRGALPIVVAPFTAHVRGAEGPLPGSAATAGGVERLYFGANGGLRAVAKDATFERRAGGEWARVPASRKSRAGVPGATAVVTAGAYRTGTVTSPSFASTDT